MSESGAICSSHRSKTERRAPMMKVNKTYSTQIWRAREKKKRRITHNTFKGHRRGRVAGLELYKYRRCRVGFRGGFVLALSLPPAFILLFQCWYTRNVVCSVWPRAVLSLFLSSHGKHTHTCMLCVFNLDLMEWDCCRAAFKRNLDPFHSNSPFLTDFLVFTLLFFSLQRS